MSNEDPLSYKWRDPLPNSLWYRVSVVLGTIGVLIVFAGLGLVAKGGLSERDGDRERGRPQDKGEPNQPRPRR